MPVLGCPSPCADQCGVKLLVPSNPRACIASEKLANGRLSRIGVGRASAPAYMMTATFHCAWSQCTVWSNRRPQYWVYQSLRDRVIRSAKLFLEAVNDLEPVRREQSAEYLRLETSRSLYDEDDIDLVRILLTRGCRCRRGLCRGCHGQVAESDRRIGRQAASANCSRLRHSKFDHARPRLQRASLGTRAASACQLLTR